MDSAEGEFRRVERLLDDLAAVAEKQLLSANVQSEDKSARTYHYKNDHLFWERMFLKEWRVESERARVTVNLMYGEPIHPSATPELKLSWRAELFQHGHESRIDKRGKSECSLSDIQQQGLAGLVLGAIHEGSGHLPKAL